MLNGITVCISVRVKWRTRRKHICIT